MQPLSNKPRLIGIVHENVGNELEEFIPYWPSGGIYLNKDRSVYKAFGGGSLRKLSIKQLFSLSAIKGAYSQAMSAVRSGEIKGNLTGGNGMILGGVMVVGKNKKMIYQWKQQYETLANTQEIKNAIELTQSNSSNDNNNSKL